MYFFQILRNQDITEFFRQSGKLRVNVFMLTKLAISGLILTLRALVVLFSDRRDDLYIYLAAPVEILLAPVSMICALRGFATVVTAWVL